MTPTVSPEHARARRFSTLDLAEPERQARWEAWNRAALIAVETATPHGRGLRASQSVLALPGVSLAQVRGEAHRVRRSAETVARCPTGSLAVYVMLSGSARFTGGGRQGPGTAAVVDADHPFERSFAQGFVELVLTVPQTSPTRQDIRTVDGVAAVRVRALARQLSRAVLDESDTRAVALDVVADLVHAGRAGDRLALARLLIDQHLGDPALSAARLAAAVDVSDRQLSRLFAGAGTTVPAEITQRRLDRASALLVAQPDRPVAEVSRACGFSSASYFDRVFRSRFGLTPRQHRAA